jgi:CBS domain-containing protein
MPERGGVERRAFETLSRAALSQPGLTAPSNRKRFSFFHMLELLPSDVLRPYLVEDLMTKHVYTARPNESLLSAAQTMRSHHISGLPVVSPPGKVVGVLSEKDIVGELDRQVGVGRARGILDILLASYGLKRKDILERSVDALLKGFVRDAMSHPAATVEADSLMSEAWRLLRLYSVNRLPVLRNDSLVGIITRHDVLKLLRNEAPAVRSGPIRSKSVPR